MDAETFMTVAVIALALFMALSCIYAIGLSFAPRYARRDAIVTVLRPTLPVECKAVREAREIIENCWDNKEEVL